MAKILYLSCHSILEYDEVKLLHELGHEVFSPGAYVEPANPGDSSLRPGIDGLTYDPELVELWNQHEQKHPAINGKEYLGASPEILERFDIILNMHMPSFIAKNWSAIKNKRVIWRTIGQSVASTEDQMRPFRQEGMEIVRYSPMEATGIPNFIGQDALIRFYKDPDEYGPWNGDKQRVVSFAQHMKSRDTACNFGFFEKVTRPYERALFGPGNTQADWMYGKVPFEQLKQEMCDNRVYFYTGTHPASYTLNFMEAWMTGIPIVAIGPQRGNASYFAQHQLYEIPHLIQNGQNGICSDDPVVLRKSIQLLLNDHDAARAIGENGRTEAIKHFGKDMIKEAWRAYLGD